MKSQYSFLDSGNGQKLERFGEFLLVRPCSQAIWSPKLPLSIWDAADAWFSRDEGNRWEVKEKPGIRPLADTWQVTLSDLHFHLKRTDFGHLGIFPEQARFWSWIQNKLKPVSEIRPLRVLNLFAYSGGSSLAAAKAGAHVVHLDASKGMINWAKENALLNGCENKISWIVDDVMKFLRRWVRREEKFDAIISDPPTFGRGPKGELFKIERDFPEILTLCKELLSDKPLFYLLSCHTPGFTPLLLKQLLQENLSHLRGSVAADEMELSGSDTYRLPSGAFALWEASDWGG